MALRASKAGPPGVTRSRRGGRGGPGDHRRLSCHPDAGVRRAVRIGGSYGRGDAPDRSVVGCRVAPRTSHGAGPLPWVSRYRPGSGSCSTSRRTWPVRRSGSHSGPRRRWRETGSRSAAPHLRHQRRGRRGTEESVRGSCWAGCWAMASLCGLVAGRSEQGSQTLGVGGPAWAGTRCGRFGARSGGAAGYMTLTSSSVRQ